MSPVTIEKKFLATYPHDCHQAKKEKNKKCHASHMVWPWLSSTKEKEKQTISRMPSGWAVVAIGVAIKVKIKRNTKNCIPSAQRPR
jgi:hypothetical protein